MSKPATDPFVNVPNIDLPDGWYQNTIAKHLFIAVRNKRPVMWFQNYYDPDAIVNGKQWPYPKLTSDPQIGADPGKLENAEEYVASYASYHITDAGGIGTYMKADRLKLYQKFQGESSEPGWAPTLLTVAGVLTGLGLLNSKKKTQVIQKPQAKAVKATQPVTQPVEK